MAGLLLQQALRSLTSSTRVTVPGVERSAFMHLFYFNFRDEEGLLSDSSGAEYENLEQAKTAAAQCLTELARDQGAVPGPLIIAGGMQTTEGCSQCGSR